MPLLPRRPASAARAHLTPLSAAWLRWRKRVPVRSTIAWAEPPATDAAWATASTGSAPRRRAAAPAADRAGRRSRMPEPSVIRAGCLGDPHGQLVAESGGVDRRSEGRSLAGGRDNGAPDDPAGVCERAEMEVVLVPKVREQREPAGRASRPGGVGAGGRRHAPAEVEQGLDGGLSHRRRRTGSGRRRVNQLFDDRRYPSTTERIRRGDRVDARDDRVLERRAVGDQQVVGQLDARAAAPRADAVASSAREITRRAPAAGVHLLLDDEQPARLLDAGADRVAVERPEPAQVDDLGVRSRSRASARRPAATRSSISSVDDDRDVGARAHDCGLADLGDARRRRARPGPCGRTAPCARRRAPGRRRGSPPAARE